MNLGNHTISNGHEPSGELKRIHIVQGFRGRGRVHEDGLIKDVAHWQRAFDLLVGKGPMRFNAKHVVEELATTCGSPSSRTKTEELLCS